MSNEYKNSKIVHVNLEDTKNEVVQEINLLREKTFNNELGSILGQIFSHEEKYKDEKKGSKIETAEVPLDKNEVLTEIENLIYEMKHFEYGSSGTSFNPFLKFIDVNDEIEDLETYMEIAMEQAGYPEYSLLRFNVEDAAFRPDFSTFNDDFNNNICIDLNDPLFKKIQESPEGYLLTAGEIGNNIFLRKQYGDNRGNFVLVRSSRFYRKTGVYDFNNINLTDFSEFLAPVLIFRVGDDFNKSPGNMMETLEDYVAIPLSIYIMKKRMFCEMQNFTYEQVLQLIDLFAGKFVKENLCCFILSLNDYSVKENLFLFKYFLSKIKGLLDSNSLIFRTSIDKAIVLPRNNEHEEVLKAIEEFMQINPEIVSSDMIRDSETMKEFDLIKFFI